MVRRRHRRRRLRLQRAHKTAALGPDQPGAERRDQAIADDLDRLLRRAHRLGGRGEQPGEHRNQRHRHQRLQQRRGERQHDAAPRGFLVGDEIGRDHRLAVAGAGGVKDAVGKGNSKQRPDRAAVRLRRAYRRRHLAIEFGLLGEDPSDDAADLRLGGRPRTAERILRHQRMHGGVEHHDGRERGDCDRYALRKACRRPPHGQSTMILLAYIAP